MAQYTFIKTDSTIYKDGIVAFDCDFSESNDFHAIQFNTETGGHLEYIDDQPNINIADQNDLLTISGLSLSTWITRYNNALSNE